MEIKVAQSKVVRTNFNRSIIAKMLCYLWNDFLLLNCKETHFFFLNSESQTFGSQNFSEPLGGHFTKDIF